MRKKSSVSADHTSPATTYAIPLLSPQHQCLFNSDLLEQIILAQIPADTGTAAARSYNARPQRIRQSLFNVALTCKAFQPSAIKVLWQKLDSLIPLLCLLPSVQRSGRTYDLTAPLVEEDWAIFDRHAAHVRELVDNSYQGGETLISPLLLVILAMRKSPLLPNLARIVSTYGDPGAELILCLSPSITSIQFSRSGSGNPMKVFVAKLSSECPRLSHLTLSGTSASIVEFLDTFQYLKSFDLQGHAATTTALFVRVGSLPRLSHFKIHMGTWDEVEFHETASRGSFLQLTHLEIETTAALSRHWIPAFFPILGTTRIRSLSVNTRANERYGANEVSDAFPVISRAICERWATSLETLHLQGLRCTSEADFSALVCAINLRHVKLDDILSGSLTNVLHVFAAWPHLISLSLSTGFVDIPFLQCIADHCPALTALEVAFGPGELPATLLSPPAPSHGLRQLTSIKTRASGSLDVHRLARHLDSLFPRLESIRSGGGGQWEELGKLVQMCQEVRRDTLAQRAQE